MSKSVSAAVLSGSSTQVLRRFRVVFAAVRNHFKQIEKVVGLGGAQVWALSVIQSQPGVGLGDLARAMDVHQSTASNLVKGLQQKGLLRAEKGQKDKRQVQLFVEPAGLQLLGMTPGPFEGVLPDALNHLNPQTLNRLDHDLAELIELLHADEANGAMPLAHL